MDVVISDRIDMRRTDVRMDVGRGSVDRIDVNSQSRSMVNVSDSLQLVPYYSMHSIEYTLPASITQGVMVDVAQLQADILDKVGTAEVAHIAQTTYTSSPQYQRLIDLEATAVTNSQLDASILNIDFSNYTIKDNNGVAIATMQEIASNSVSVENSTASVVENTQAAVTNSRAAITKVNELEASQGALKATVKSTEYAIAGKFTQVVDEANPVAGEWKGSAGSYEVYTDQWESITDAEWEHCTTGVAVAGSSSLAIVGDKITGWQASTGVGGVSDFKISADKFSLVNSDGSATPLVIDATDPDDVQMKFTGTVTFGGSTDTSLSNLDSTANDAIGTAQTTADTANSTSNNALVNYVFAAGTTVIDGGKITAGAIVLNELDTATVPDNYSGTIVDKSGMRVYIGGTCVVKVGEI